MTGGGVLTILSLFASTASDSVYGVVRDALTGVPLAGVNWRRALRLRPISAPRMEVTRRMVSLPVTKRLASGWMDTEVSSWVSRSRLEPPTWTWSWSDSACAPCTRSGSSRDSASESPPPTVATIFGDRVCHVTTTMLASNPVASGDDPLLAAAADASTSGFPSALRVHGGASDQNLVLLDGLPVYGLILGGVASLFDPDAVESIDLHSDVPPANLQRAPVDAINVHLRPQPRGNLHLSGAWGLHLVATARRGVPGEGSSVDPRQRAASYRGVFAQDGDGLFGNDFRDILARGSLRLGAENLQLYLLNGSDQLSFPSAVHGVPLTDHDQPGPVRNQFDSSSTTAGAVWIHSHSAVVLTTRSWLASSVPPSTGQP